MTAWEKFCQTAAEGRLSPTPEFDVTGDVCRAIRVRRQLDETTREPLWIVAGISLSMVAAAVAILTAVPAWQEAYEYARLLPNPLTLVLQ